MNKPNSMYESHSNRELMDKVTLFTDWSQRLLGARTWITSQPLFHYTSAENFEKILNSGVLWLTRLQQQKDPTELSFGLRLFEQIVAENAPRAAPSPLHRMFFDKLRQINGQFFNDNFDCHLACFAPHGEDFDLWERYGDNGHGVAIGVNADFFAVREPTQGEPLWFVQPVTYGALAPLHQMNKLLQVAVMALGRMAPLIHSNAECDYAINAVTNQMIAGHILPLCMLSKDDSYQHEIEVRVLSPRVRTDPNEPRPHHITLPFPLASIVDCVLVGENADRRHIEDVAARTGIRAEIIDVAAFSKGLSQQSTSD